MQNSSAQTNRQTFLKQVAGLSAFYIVPRQVPCKPAAKSADANEVDRLKIRIFAG